MHKHEEYRMDTQDMRSAIQDYLIKHKVIESEDMIREIHFFAEENGGDECITNIKTMSEKVEGT